MKPRLHRLAFICTVLLASAVSTGCAHAPAAWDYTAFMRAKPATLLVLPPVNDSPDIKASSSVWANATLPLAEAGYYVLPVTLVDETFRQNGVFTPADAQDIPGAKLREFFGADAAVYIRVKRYGTSYAVVASDTTVQVEARVIDLRSGELLWKGEAQASSSENQQTQGGLTGLLVSAVVNQIVSTASDAGYRYAVIADQRLLAAGRDNGMLAGPRSPNYGKPPGAR